MRVSRMPIEGKAILNGQRSLRRPWQISLHKLVHICVYSSGFETTCEWLVFEGRKLLFPGGRGAIIERFEHGSCIQVNEDI